MKRIIVATAATLTALSLTGCGSTPTSAPTVTETATHAEAEDVTIGAVVLEVAWDGQSAEDQQSVCDLHAVDAETVTATFWGSLDVDTRAMVTEDDVRSFFASECA